jgi:hypothetical protein
MNVYNNRAMLKRPMRKYHAMNVYRRNAYKLPWTINGWSWSVWSMVWPPSPSSQYSRSPGTHWQKSEWGQNRFGRNNFLPLWECGARGSAVGWGTTLQTGRSRARFPMVPVGHNPHHGPGVDWAPNRNQYQEYFVGGKDGRCVRLTILPPSWASTSWNPQGLSRPEQRLLVECAGSSSSYGHTHHSTSCW